MRFRSTDERLFRILLYGRNRTSQSLRPGSGRRRGDRRGAFCRRINRIPAFSPNLHPGDPRISRVFFLHKKSLATLSLQGSIRTRDGTRTHTNISVQRILSPSCLPFHHPSIRPEKMSGTKVKIFCHFAVIRIPFSEAIRTKTQKPKRKRPFVRILFSRFVHLVVTLILP